VFPASGAPGWLKLVIEVNPLTYGLAAVRWSIYGVSKAAQMSLPSFALSFGVSLLFAAFVFATAILVTRRTSS